MKRLNKNGFSLIELLVVIAILGVLSAILVPSLTASTGSIDRRVDEAAINNLQMTLQLAIQHNSMYKDAKDIAENTSDEQLIVVYNVDGNNNLILDRCEAIDVNVGKTTSYDNNEVGEELESLRSSIVDFINGKIEPIELQSEEYSNQGYYFYIQFPDVDYKVNIERGQGRFEAATSSSLGAPGLYGGTYKDGSTWVFPSNTSRLHLHTGYGGLASSELGDKWKVTMTGENLSQFYVRHSYYKDGQGWVGGAGTYSNTTNTDTMFEFYFTAEEDWPKIGFMIYSGSSDEAIVENIQFTKVG